MGARRRTRMEKLARILARYLVRRAQVLRLARDQSLQDAHPRAAVEVPRLHALPRLRRRAAQARRAAVAPGHEAGRGQGFRYLQKIQTAGRGMERGEALRTARPD